MRWQLSILHYTVRIVLIACVGFYALALLSLVALRWVNPPTTAVQAERRVQAAIHRAVYRKVETFVPLAQISTAMQHAVVAAEDARFFCGTRAQRTRSSRRLSLLRTVRCVLSAVCIEDVLSPAEQPQRA